MKLFQPFILLLVLLTLAGTDAVNAQCTSGTCDNGYGTYSYTTGDKYTGHFSGGKRNGQGTYTWANGNSHTGENMNDHLHGQGTFIFKTTGDKYVGNFSYGVRSGYGTFYWKNGNKYEGYWVNDKMHGKGTYTYATGKVEKGTWENDVYKGEGSTGSESSNFCTAMNKIREAMAGDFASIKGTEYYDEDKAAEYWASTVTLPGADYSDIEGASEAMQSSAYFRFHKSASYSEAETEFNALKTKVENCKPYDWYAETDAEFTADDRIEYVIMDDDYYNLDPGRYISLTLVKDKTDGMYYVELFFCHDNRLILTP